ncbi:glycoside hydrolase family 3 C-terminal domain-containing protein [Spirillospora sp. NPDC048911]|uniref:glycoside hydrolase family 3 C-terminal domain-containing protein n=1 Tax=Spirillospora sp. NPDC048911 TaxID=3364527 RepID=UPI003721A855
MIDRLLSSLDLDAKLRLITGTGLWSTAEAPEIGLRALHLSDGPVGVRGWWENERNTSANLPSPTALAASWDEDLLRRVGEFLAAEAVAKEVEVVLGPTINLHRAPRGGRHFESYSEDPLLTGRLAAAYVDGIQRRGIAACPKHYVANDSETDRFTVDVRVADRTLRELYLAPFEHVVRESRPWSIMAAYNGVNGASMTENPLLDDPLRSEWGFDGVVVSDWGAVRSTEASARAGTDLAMPGPEARWGEALAEAVRSGAVPEDAIDRKVRRLLLLAERLGALTAAAIPNDPAAPGDTASGRVASPASAVWPSSVASLSVPGPDDANSALGSAASPADASLADDASPSDGDADPGSAGLGGVATPGGAAPGGAAGPGGAGPGGVAAPGGAGPGGAGPGGAGPGGAGPGDVACPGGTGCGGAAGASDHADAAGVTGLGGDGRSGDGAGSGGVAVLGGGAALAREASAAGMVLLRNEGGVLPLAADATVALIGPGSREPRIQGGGSAAVTAPYTVTPEQGMRAVWGERLVQADGVRLHSGLRQPAGDDIVSGTVSWLSVDGAELVTEPAHTAGVFRSKATTPAGATACELRATLRAAESGTWELGGFGTGDLEVRINDGPVVAEHTVTDPRALIHAFFDPPQASTSLDLQAGEEVAVTVRFTWPSELPMFRVQVGLRQAELPAEDEFSRAVDAAQAADVAVVVIGTTEAIESEGFDRAGLSLPGRQDELVAAVAAVNSRTVVVVNTGAPVLMPWRADVAAVLLGWFPGMEFGNALADVLSGAVEPGGRLPTTWPATSVPVDNVTPSDGVLTYTEGLHIGHRAYLRNGVTPAYWFGAGTGYTHWEHEGFTVEGTTAHVAVRNTGDRPGKHVVQLYLSRPGSAVERPVRWLAGYATVHAAPGERVEVTVPIAERAFQHWNGRNWETEPGPFALHLARSAGEVLAERPVQPCTSL